MSLEYFGGRFWVYYRPTGRYGKPARHPVPVYIQDQCLARAYHDKFIAEWRAMKGRQTEALPLTGLSIGKLWKEYLKWSELHHAATTHKDLLGITKFIERYLGQYDAEGIGPHHVQIYQRMRAGESVKKSKGQPVIIDGKPVQKLIPRAINKELAYLGGFVKWASRNRHITPRRLQVDKLKYNRPIPIILSVDEVLGIFRAADTFYRAFFLCLYSLGLRIGEVRTLRWANVDRENMTVTVQQKGGSYKSLPMGESLREALEALGTRGAEDLVFESRRRDGKGGPVRDIRPAIKRACKVAKIEKRVTPHLFRHSISCHLMSKNVNASIIQKMLGHAQLSTTQWYSHVSAANLKDVGDVISGLISGNRARETRTNRQIVHTRKRKRRTGACLRTSSKDS